MAVTLYVDSHIFYISHLIPETDIFLSPVPLHFRQVLFLPTVLTVPMLSLTSNRSCSLHRFCQRPLLFHISQIRSRYALRSYQIYPVTYLPAIYQSLLFRSQCPLFPLQCPLFWSQCPLFRFQCPLIRLRLFHIFFKRILIHYANLRP